MLWACVAASHTGIITRGQGRMDSTKYQQILEASIKPSVKKKKKKKAEAEKRKASTTG